MAAALFEDLLRRNGLRGRFRVESAGTWAGEGDPVTPMALAVMRERGLDVSGHRSRRVTGQMLREFDWVLVMEAGHREALLAEFPDLEPHLHLLTSVAGEPYDISDPVAGTLDTYRATADELEDLLKRGLPRFAQGLP
jgi:protein-tyrosine-phosphatase